jgi:hypothetical protein
MTKRIRVERTDDEDAHHVHGVVVLPASTSAELQRATLLARSGRTRSASYASTVRG